MRPSIAVIGAGLTGLTVAFELQERAERLPDGAEILCFENSGRAGGLLVTDRQDGFLFERGAGAFSMDDPVSQTMLRRLGLADQVVSATTQSHHAAVFRNGALRAVPDRPLRWLRGDLLGGTSKLRALFERFASAPGDGIDESVLEFAVRRFGHRAGSLLADAWATYHCLGDPAKLSAASNASRLVEIEREQGRLMASLLPKGGRPEEGMLPWGIPTPQSLRGGMQQWVDALTKKVAPLLRTDARVEAISDMGLRGFRILLDQGAPLDVDAVILACPANAAAKLVRTMDPGMCHALSGIQAVPSVRMGLGFRAEAIGPRTRGAGFVVPRGEGLRILGCEYASELFPHRAPEGAKQLMVWMGGAHDPDAVGLDPEQVRDAALRDLRLCTGIVAEPYVTHVSQTERAIPQYTIGHARRLEELERRRREHAGLWLAGASYRGTRIETCLREAVNVAESALNHIAGRPQAMAR